MTLCKGHLKFDQHGVIVERTVKSWDRVTTGQKDSNGDILTNKSIILSPTTSVLQQAATGRRGQFERAERWRGDDSGWGGRGQGRGRGRGRDRDIDRGRGGRRGRDGWWNDWDQPFDSHENVETTEEVENIHLLDISSFPPLNRPPKIGDVLVFKMLELSKMKTPEISDFKEAEVRGYNSQKQIITVKPTNPAASVSTNWFFQQQEDEDIDDQDPSSDQPETQLLPVKDLPDVVLELSDLIEPKLLPSQFIIKQQDQQQQDQQHQDQQQQQQQQEKQQEQHSLNISNQEEKVKS